MPNSAPYNNVQQERLIIQIQNGGPQASKAMKELYTNYNYKMYLKQYSSDFGTSINQVNDYFHEAFITFIKKVKKPNFVLKSDINVYITSIAKNLIQNHSRKKKTEQIVDENLPKYGVDESPATQYLEDESKKTIRDFISNVDPHCRRVLRLWQNEFSYLEISQKLDLDSPTQARQHKHRSLKKLVDLLPQFPELKEFNHER